MNKKFFTVSIILLAAAAVIFSGLALAKNDKGAENVPPEVDGTYDVPGHPNMKVRVFVHKAPDKPDNPGKPEKTGKPTPEPPVLSCGLTDPGSLSVVSWAGWKLPSSFTYNLNPNDVPVFIASSEWPVIVEKSFGAWNNASTSLAPQISAGSATQVNRSGLDGNNIVAWGRTSGSALGVTYVWYYTATREVAEVDTIMNKKFTWEWADQSIDPGCAYADAYDAQNILTHEVGHWYGLDDEYNGAYSNNTMYGYGSKWEVKKNTLTSGDILGLWQIYP